LIKKMNKFRKKPTEKEMLGQLREGKVQLPPLSIRFLDRRRNVGVNPRLDAFIEVSWQQNLAKFVVECKALSTPKAFRNSVNLLKTLPIPKGYLPLLFMPFLNEKQLRELEREGISGIDLCGNGVVIVPDSFAVFRSGGKNRFPSSALIKNIYRKNSSMVGRVFLHCFAYDSVQEVCAEINRRNPLVNRWSKKAISLSTVSKALKTLEEDLIILRESTIKLVQPDKLLEKLSQNYDNPMVKRRIRMKVSENEGALLGLLLKISEDPYLPLVATGLSSITQYAVMQRGDMLSVYCPRLEGLLELLPGDQSNRFPNLELLETEDETVYFDARQQGGIWRTSPVQVYLELMSGDKRDREVAEQVKSLLMKDFESVKP
jgi:hypothetical protein